MASIASISPSQPDWYAAVAPSSTGTPTQVGAASLPAPDQVILSAAPTYASFGLPATYAPTPAAASDTSTGSASSGTDAASGTSSTGGSTTSGAPTSVAADQQVQLAQLGLESQLTSALLGAGSDPGGSSVWLGSNMLSLLNTDGSAALSYLTPQAAQAAGSVVNATA